MNPTIGNSSGQIFNSGFSRHFGRRGSWAAQSIAAVSMRHCQTPPTQRVGERRARFPQLRNQRRRRGVVWAFIAAVAFVTSLDWTFRIDEVAYNEFSSRTPRTSEGVKP